MGKGSKWSKSERSGRYSGPFIGHLTEMLESPAYRVLSLSALRALARLEIELMNHAGHENGRLIVTFSQFEEYGVRRHSIAAAQRELEALGFIEITERGCAGNANFGKANKFRLTYRPAEGVSSDGSHEWRRIKTIEEAILAQKTSHKPPLENVAKQGGRRVKNKNSAHVSGGEPPHASSPNHPTKRGQVGPKPHPTNRGVLSRSGSGQSAAGAAAMLHDHPPAVIPAQPKPATAPSQPDEANPWTPPP